MPSADIGMWKEEMFKEICTPDARAEYQLFSDCKDSEKVYERWKAWLVEGDASARFIWRIHTDGNIEVENTVRDCIRRVDLC